MSGRGALPAPPLWTRAHAACATIEKEKELPDSSPHDGLGHHRTVQSTDRWARQVARACRTQHRRANPFLATGVQYDDSRPRRGFSRSSATARLLLSDLGGEGNGKLGFLPDSSRLVRLRAPRSTVGLRRTMTIKAD